MKDRMMPPRNYRQYRTNSGLTSLGNLAASIAHEVNNPLTGVLLYTKLLYKKINSDDISKGLALEYLLKMDIDLTRTTGLIRDLRDFACQSKPTFSETNFNDVLDRALDYIAHTADLQNISITKELDLSQSKITADFEQLQRAFTNLIQNAVQAMPQGGALTLRSYPDGDQLKIEVRDTGHGISKENMRKLFTPFFSTKSEVKGVGLGLAVAYGIIRRHGGNITVQSQVAKGSVFTVSLPLYR